MCVGCAVAVGAGIGEAWQLTRANMAKHVARTRNIIAFSSIHCASSRATHDVSGQAPPEVAALNFHRRAACADHGLGPGRC